MIERALFLILKLYVGYRPLLNGAVGSDMKHMMKAAPGYEFLATSMSVADSIVSVFHDKGGRLWIIVAFSRSLCVCTLFDGRGKCIYYVTGVTGKAHHAV